MFFNVTDNWFVYVVCVPLPFSQQQEKKGFYTYYLVKMTCRGFIQFLLKVINFLFALVGLAMIGYGIYMFVIWNNSSSSSTTTSPPPPPPPDEFGLRYQSPPDLPLNQFDRDNAINGLQLRRALLQENPKSSMNNLSSFWSSIPTAWWVINFVVLYLDMMWSLDAIFKLQALCISEEKKIRCTVSLIAIPFY